MVPLNKRIPCCYIHTHNVTPSLCLYCSIHSLLGISILFVMVIGLLIVIILMVRFFKLLVKRIILIQMLLLYSMNLMFVFFFLSLIQQLETHVHPIPKTMLSSIDHVDMSILEDPNTPYSPSPVVLNINCVMNRQTVQVVKIFVSHIMQLVLILLVVWILMMLSHYVN